MSGWTERRLAAVGAVVFVVLGVVGLVPREPPKANGSAAAVVRFFVLHHRAVLAGTVLMGIALVVFIGVMAQLLLLLRDAGQAGLAAVVAIGATATVAILAVGVSLHGALARVATSGGNPETIRALYQVGHYVTTESCWTLLAVVVAVGLAGMREPSRAGRRG